MATAVREAFDAMADEYDDLRAPWYRYSLGLIEHDTVQPAYLAVAGLSVVTMIVLNVWTHGYTKMFCVLIGMVVGYVASAALGMLEVAAAVPAELPMLRVPHLQNASWQFDGLLLAPFTVVAVATTLRAMGDISNAQRLNVLGCQRCAFRGEEAAARLFGERDPLLGGSSLLHQPRSATTADCRPGRTDSAAPAPTERSLSNLVT